MNEIAAAAKSASIRLAAVNIGIKNNALAEIEMALNQRSAEIIAANQQDLAEAQRNNLAYPLLKRLKFDESKIAQTIAGIESLIKLEDPLIEKYISYKYPRTAAMKLGALRNDKAVLNDGIGIGKELVIYRGIENWGKDKGLLIGE